MTYRSGTSTCPECGEAVTAPPLFVRERTPVFNNVVYRDRESALSCAVGKVTITRCVVCGWIFNADYLPNAVEYGTGYDASRSHSQAFRTHADAVCERLAAQIRQGGRILEVGCGDGEFLARLCGRTACEGVGYDPAASFSPVEQSGITLIPACYDPAADKKRYDAIVARHLLEHLPSPRDFLRSLADPSVLEKNAILAVEVPSYEWIRDNGAFTDFTYEHCNYFTRETLERVILQAGFSIRGIERVFGGQYYLATAVWNGGTTGSRPFETMPGPDCGFESTKDRIMERMSLSETVCVWGASGKGVLFLCDVPSSLLDRIRYVVDINPLKQGAFLPLSGKQVVSPSVLKGFDGELLVIAMNPVYAEEIGGMLSSLGVSSCTLMTL